MSGIQWPHMPQPRHISAIVEEQAQRFTIREHSGQLVTMEDWPVVTISCEYGVPGSRFGRRLAEGLGFDLWDRARVRLVAQGVHRRAAIFPATRLRIRSTVEDFMSLFSSRHGGVSNAYAVHVHRVLDYIRRLGRSVIVGRGVRRLIDPYPALHLRLVAPIGQRVLWVAMRDQSDIKTVKNRLKRGDKKHAAIEHRAVKHDKDDPTYYDLVINMATFDNERAVGVVRMAYLAKFGKLPAPARSPANPLLFPIVHLPPPTVHTLAAMD